MILKYYIFINKIKLLEVTLSLKACKTKGLQYKQKKIKVTKVMNSYIGHKNCERQTIKII